MPADKPIYLAAQRKRGVQLDGRVPPFGIMCVGEALRRAGYRVRLFHLDGEEGERLFKKAVAEEPPLFAGFSNCLSSTLIHDLRLSRFLRGLGVPVVWGGVFPTMLPEPVLRSAAVDYIVQGEGERPAVELARAIEEREVPAGVPGVGYLEEGEVKLNPPPALEQDLDRYPPGLDLIDWSAYLVPGAGGERFTSITVSRGCPFGCSFCTNSMSPERRVWRAYSREHIKEMVKFLAERYGVRGFYIQDDNPFGKVRQGMERVEALGMPWISTAHLQYVDHDFLAWAKERWCRRLDFGIESGSDRMLRRMNKKTDRKMILERMELVGKAGLPSFAMWMVFMPGETVEDRRLTFSLMKELRERNPIVQMHLSVFQAYPRTPFWEESLALGLKEPETLEEWAGFTGMIYPLLGVSPRQVKRMMRTFRALYYFDASRDRLPRGVRPLLERRLLQAEFNWPLEEALHLARVVRDQVKKIAREAL